MMMILGATPLRTTTRPAQGRKSTHTVCQVPRAAKPSASRRETLLASTVLPVMPALAGIFGPFPGTPPTDIGPQAGGGLQQCPKTPNCFSSSAPTDDSHYVAPFPYNKSTASAVADVKAIIASYPTDLAYGDGGGAALVSSDKDYVYANFTSKKFGFVDDVEFLFDNGKMLIRSASRLGESDGDVNKNRIAFIKTSLEAKGGWM